MQTSTISQHDWSLHRKGSIDQERHKQKIREAVKKNLADIVSEESIILSDGKKIVKVPIRSLDEYRFRFDPGGSSMRARATATARSATWWRASRAPARASAARLVRSQEATTTRPT